MMAITAEQLNQQTKALKTLVNQFKLRQNGSPAPIKAAHNGGLSEVVVDKVGQVREVA